MASKVDVLIIGAGPAGLFAAQALARAGVKVRIVDKRPTRVAAGHADGIQPRTIEVLQSYDLAAPLLEQGNHMNLAAFYNPGPSGGIERTNRAPDVTAPTARYPFEVTLHQGAIEQIMLDSMSQHGLEVDRPYAPVSLELSAEDKVLQDPQSYAIKVTLQKLNGDGSGSDEHEVVQAKYVIGTDGAHSWVRKSLDIEMEGEQTDYVWGVLDSIPESDFPDIRHRTVIHSNNGSCMVIPREGDKVRVYVQLAEVEVGQSGRLDKSTMGPEKIMSVAQKSFKPFTISWPNPIEWWTLYIIGQRVAARYAVHDRVFIAGDACHTHSPKAGQGMNASMNDSHNLAWKLVHVLRGSANPALLQTYESERRKYAQELITFDKQFSKLFSGKPRTEDHQDGVAHTEFLKAFQTFGGFTSGIGVHYPPSMIIDASHQHLAPKLVIGERLIPQTIIRSADARALEIQDLCKSDTRFKILFFVGDTSSPERVATLAKLAQGLEVPTGFLKLFASERALDSPFRIFTVSNTPKERVNYNAIPEILRSHWSTVFTDDVSVAGTSGGTIYSSYGISVTQGATVVVRPDGYVGLVTGLLDVPGLTQYFAKFLVRCDL